MSYFYQPFTDVAYAGSPMRAPCYATVYLLVGNKRLTVIVILAAFQ